ncbi:hypothetical protein FPRO04_13725 [Fusarium proliferatum]|nr:hypothetical protein FPRO04_13725 [Fusarium proliferatum]
MVKETCPMPNGVQSSESQTYLWWRCCIRHHLGQLYDGDIPESGQNFYYESMLRDAEAHAEESLLSSVTVEQRLALIVDATDRLFDRCGDTIRSTDVCVRRWLRVRFPDFPYNAPFELVSKSSSERVYRKELKRCLCFWLRLLQFPPRTIKAILGQSLRRSQHQELARLWDDHAWSVDQGRLLTDAPIPCDESVSDESSDEDQDEDEGQGSEDDCTEWSREEILDYSDGYSTTRNSPTPHITTPADPAADLVLRLAYYMTTEDFADGRSSSTMLVFFSAVRGLSDRDAIIRPHRFTPVLSRLIYCIFIAAPRSTFITNTSQEWRG